VIHRRWQVIEEPLEELEVGGIEGRRAQRINFSRSALETLGIPTSEDDRCAFRASVPGRFESDAGAYRRSKRRFV